ncbi:nucleolar complex protein 4 homolog isoform X2 [Lycorma delicatula]|uniref:nucleolar complex protein 4 homolog isoform X2 n=1 Tax=Lycorma delicatula TaxID=130591 RepID=UPI003F5145DE
MIEHDFNNPALKKCKVFLSSRKNSNVIIEILALLEVVADVEISHLLAIQMLFQELDKNNQLCLEGLEEDGEEYKYRKWLSDCFEKCFSRLLKILSESQDVNIQKQVLTTLLLLSDVDVKNYSIKKKALPVVKLSNTIEILLKHDKNITDLIPTLKDYIVNVQGGASDRFWISLGSIVQKLNHPDQQNIINLLSIVESFPSKKKSQTLNINIAGGVSENKDVRISVDKVWDWCLKHHSPATLKNVLIGLLEHFMPLLSNPIFLTDFLINALNTGGATALLALQGIYILILKHNIDYPNIYGKLYTMLQPEIFRMKYKARFFYLLDLFLTSTHLPKQMVASFVKRLARLALNSTPQDILILLPFIGNLLIRHPGLKVLVNHPVGGSVDEDPFIMEESNPMHTKALSSSLWEVKSLQHHILPQVSKFAMFINEPIPSVEWDLSDRLEITSDQIFHKERNKKAKTMSVTFERPSSLSIPRGFAFDKIWLLQ